VEDEALLHGAVALIDISGIIVNGRFEF